MAAAVRPAADRNGGEHVINRGAADRPVDLDAAERAAADFLTALGDGLEREERRATPARMARAYAELLAAQPFRLTTFPNDEGYDELVLARAIPFRTVCEHHMLLFSGVAHVGYLPGDRILGLSKLARLVDHFAAQPQTQERLTMQVAKCLDANLHPRGVGAVLAAEHTCMTQPGIRALAATPVTPAPPITSPGFSARQSLRDSWRYSRSWRHDLSLADHGDSAAGHHEAARPVVVLVHSHRGALLDDDVLVQDGVLDQGVTTDQGIVQDHRPVHTGRAVHPD